MTEIRIINPFFKTKPAELGEWIPHEYSKEFEGGGSILIRGYKCSCCGFFRHRKHGTSKFCEDCGKRMRVEVADHDKQKGN